MKKLIFSLLILAGHSLLYGQCFQDRHNTSENEAWISCIPSINPNSTRGLSHWIMYDFGEVYKLGQSHFWNINTAGKTGAGIKTAYLDYSNDGINWTEWGTFDLEEANASGFYEGEDGPDLNELEAQYLLITVIDNYGNLCHGLSEIRIETSGLSTSTEEVDLLSSEMLIHPNPAKDMAFLKVELNESLESNLTLTDMSGRVVKTDRIYLSKGINELPISLSGLSSGLYLVSLINERFTHTVNLSVFNDQ